MTHGRSVSPHEESLIGKVQGTGGGHRSTPDLTALEDTAETLNRRRCSLTRGCSVAEDESSKVNQNSVSGLDAELKAGGETG